MVVYATFYAKSNYTSYTNQKWVKRLKKTGNGKTARIDYQFFDLTIAISPALSNLKVHLSSRHYV